MDCPRFFMMKFDLLSCSWSFWTTRSFGRPASWDRRTSLIWGTRSFYRRSWGPCSGVLVTSVLHWLARLRCRLASARSAATSIITSVLHRSTRLRYRLTRTCPCISCIVVSISLRHCCWLPTARWIHISSISLSGSTGRSRVVIIWWIRLSAGPCSKIVIIWIRCCPYIISIIRIIVSCTAVIFTGTKSGSGICICIIKRT